MSMVAAPDFNDEIPPPCNAHDEYGFVDVDGKLPDGAPDPGDPGPILEPE